MKKLFFILLISAAAAAQDAPVPPGFNFDPLDPANAHKLDSIPSLNTVLEWDTTKGHLLFVENPHVVYSMINEDWHQVDGGHFYTISLMVQYSGNRYFEEYWVKKIYITKKQKKHFKTIYAEFKAEARRIQKNLP